MLPNNALHRTGLRGKRMIKGATLTLLLAVLAGCASTPTGGESTYGYAENDPIKVGAPDGMGGPKAERAFLNRLRGPSGQQITYKRKGSCCMFETPNGFNGAGLLDQFEVTYEGLDNPVTIYINFYDPGPPRAPAGFTLEE